MDTNQYAIGIRKSNTYFFIPFYNVRHMIIYHSAIRLAAKELAVQVDKKLMGMIIANSMR